jgi:N-acetylmuramoyl-L-alanine amidase
MSANPQNVPPGSSPNDLGQGFREAAGDNGVPRPVVPRSASGFATHAPGHEALQALLAFSSLHEQIRQRRARERLGAQPGNADVWELEQFVLDEVLQLVSERALTLTGADGIAIAMAEGNAFVCRASAGTIAPEPGARLDPKSGFSGACLRSGGIVRCDDSENDPRVNVQVCRRLGTRSIVAVPIASSRGTIGLLEAFSAEAYGFNDSDVRSLNLLAELILAAMKPEEENRLAEISRRLVAGEAVAEDAGDAAAAISSRVGDIDAARSIDDDVSASAAPTDTSGEANADHLAADAIFQGYGQEEGKTGKSGARWVVIIALLLLTLAAIAAGLWWKSRRGSERQPEPSSTLAPPSEQPALTSPAANTGANPSSTQNPKPLQQLVTGIWHVSSPDSSTVIIDLQGEVQYEAHRLADPERIYFDLHGTQLSQGLFGKTIEVGDSLLARVRIAQPRKGISRVVLETNGPSDFSVSLQSNPYRLVVEIRKPAKAGTGAASAVPGVAHGEATAQERGQSRDKDLPGNNFGATTTPQPVSLAAAAGRVGDKSESQLRAHVPKFRLVLDAGHGGWDLGTVGRKGLMEKDLVLDIVDRLGKLLETRLGADVIYTRQDDTYLPLEKRTEIANLAQADMFVSVHANYSNDSSARGAETYYTNTYSSLKARTAEGGSDADATENIDWNNVDIREKVQQSRRFAVSVQQALHRALAAQIPGMRNRGVKKASYVVLTGTSMPAILAEVSFVSSPADENILKSSSYRQSIAEGLYKGIAQYAATNHHVNLASASSKPKGL